MRNTDISNIKSIVYTILFALMISCQSEEMTKDPDNAHEHENGFVHLSKTQFEALGLIIDTLARRNMNAYIETNGQLTLPPQSEATVTSIIGANITQINVIEGDKVKKGQTLARISHPELFKLQSEYIRKYSELEYLEKEYERQEKLYKEKINSGREYQKIKSEYLSLKAESKGLEYTLKMLNINTDNLSEGNIYREVSIISPINGYIRSVEVRSGQYVQSQQELFKIVDNHHIHAHFLVYEKDIQKVKIGQKVKFKLSSMENKEFEAEIFSVGKVFEADPKAVEIHAEIENTEGRLISGMYCKGRIIVNDDKRLALPEEALVREGDKKYIFSASMNGLEWEFTPVEVISGLESDAWVEIKPLEELESNMKYAYNKAYYLLSEWKKDEAGHGHEH